MVVKIEKLTPAQEAMLVEVREEWIDLALHRGTELDLTALREGVEWLYSLIDRKAPTLRVFDSPRAVQDAIPVTEYVAPLWYGSIERAAGHGAWLDAYSRLGIAEDLSRPLLKLLRARGWSMVVREEAVYVSRPPEYVKFDDEQRLHCADGAAVMFVDGWGVYAWRGTRVPKAWILEPEKLDAAEALRNDNMELRTAAGSIIGWGKVIESFPHRSLDKDPNPYYGELLSVDLPDSPDSRFLRARCGTGREVCVVVDESARTAVEAGAKSYGMTIEEFKSMEFRT